MYLANGESQSERDSVAHPINVSIEKVESSL